MPSPRPDLTAYYEQRAPQYDAIYERPERQSDLSYFARLLPKMVAGSDVLEVAAGTGYWTQHLARAASSVLATDVNPAPLDLARLRHYPRENVAFAQADAYQLGKLSGTFTALFAGFWWSHVPVAQREAFLHGIVTRLEPRSRVVLVDNRYVEGRSTPISHTDADGNTYQTRVLDGVAYSVLKNFPTTIDLSMTAAKFGDHVAIHRVEHFWLLTFQTPAERPVSLVDDRLAHQLDRLYPVVEGRHRAGQ